MKKILCLCALCLVGCSEVASTADPYDSFVYCLNQSGAHLYVSETCPHCHTQLSYFEKSVDKLNYTDCYHESAKCYSADVSAVPTWIFADGERYTGAQALETLSAKTNCQLPN